METNLGESRLCLAKQVFGDLFGDSCAMYLYGSYYSLVRNLSTFNHNLPRTNYTSGCKIGIPLNTRNPRHYRAHRISRKCGLLSNLLLHLRDRHLVVLTLDDKSPSTLSGTTSCGARSSRQTITAIFSIEYRCDLCLSRTIRIFVFQ